MRKVLLVAGAAVLLTAAVALTRPDPLRVGDMAPDFALTGATRDGVLPGKVRLSDFRDQTVVIAFFYKARTSG